MPKFISDEEMEKLEAEPAQTEPAAATKKIITDEEMAKLESSDPSFGPTADGSLRNPMEVDWKAALIDRWNKKYPGEMSVANSPLLMSSTPQSAFTGLASGATNLAERFATSPLPRKVSEATNMVGHAKGLIGKLTDLIGKHPQLSGKTEKLLDLASGAVGRKAAYSNLYSGIPQGISDAAKGVQFAQKGTAMLLDKAPQAIPMAVAAGGLTLGAVATQSDPVDRVLAKVKGTQFEAPLAEAKARGKDSFGSTYYLMYQSSPEFREALESESE